MWLQTAKSHAQAPGKSEPGRVLPALRSGHRNGLLQQSLLFVLVSATNAPLASFNSGLPRSAPADASALSPWATCPVLQLLEHILLSPALRTDPVIR